jgi:hypothetical protein
MVKSAAYSDMWELTRHLADLDKQKARTLALALPNPTRFIFLSEDKIIFSAEMFIAQHLV